MERYPTLMRILRERLAPEVLEALGGDVRPVPEEDYERAVRRAAAKARGMSQHLDYSRELIADRIGDLLSLPPGRRQTLFANCSPMFLTVLTHDLLKCSYDLRLRDPEQSLALAELANDTCDLLAQTDFLASELSCDLRAEVLGHLGNARRIRADLDGAEEALTKAGEFMAEGTGDRLLRSDLLSFRASLLCDQGYGVDAAALIDQEIKLRRLTGDKEKLGTALISRGWISCWIEPLEVACRFMHEGAGMVEDPYTQLVALQTLARRLARDGDGEHAWLTLSASVLPLAVVNEPRCCTQHRWIKGLAFRALGRLEDAEHELEAVCQTLSESGPDIGRAFASLDLACVLLAQGKSSPAKERASDAWELFLKQRVALPMLSALLVLLDAIRRGTATEALAVDVANFLSRYQLDRRLRFRVRRR